MVMSLLYKATPAEVKMLMIDPKLLELSVYEEIPHLISPVITNPKEVAEALRKIVHEMERRYRVLAEKASRNIETYNSQVGDEEHMPYIVVFIDELADLMFTAANEMEDSRTILDTHGAEQLLGKGDMLLMFPGARIIRVHGALITESEIKAATDFVKSQGKPDYTIFRAIQGIERDEDEIPGERDELYLKAVEFGEYLGEVSISSIQRRLKIGYNRAAKIMELMEEDGLVGPPRGAGKPREFLRRRR